MKSNLNLRQSGLAICAAITLAAVALPELHTLAFVTHGASFNTSTAEYYVNPNFSDAQAGTTNDQIDVMQRSADEWKINAKGSFAFTYAGTTAVAATGADGTNAVFYGGNDGNGALAVATWFTSGSTTVQFDIEFFDRDGATDYTWSIDPGPTEFDIRSVAVHEFGHVLGLGHSADANAVMFPTVTAGSTANRVISADDISGYQSIYGTGMPALPTVSAVSASQSWIDGGGTLTVSGSNFAYSGTTVTVGGVEATSVQVSDHDQLTCILPAQTGAGPHDVVVTTDATASGTLATAFTYDTARVTSAIAYDQLVWLEMMVPDDANMPYFAATAGGNTGVALSMWDAADTRTFPLDPDILFIASVYFSDGIPDWRNLQGTMDGSGNASWAFIIPDWPALQGVTIYTAAVTADAGFPSGMKTISNAVAVTFP